MLLVFCNTINVSHLLFRNKSISEKSFELGYFGKSSLCLAIPHQVLVGINLKDTSH